MAFDEEFATYGYNGYGGAGDSEEEVLGQAAAIMRRRRGLPGGAVSPYMRAMRPGMSPRAAYQPTPGRRPPPGGPPGMSTPGRRPPPPMPEAPPGRRVVEEDYTTEPEVRTIVDEMLHRRLPAWFETASKVPGAGADGELLSPLGLGTATLNAANPVITLSGAPQRPFRGERLVLNLAKSAGAALVPVNLTQFKIGENSQLVGSQALPAETFAPDAFGVRLAMSPSAPGIIIVVSLQAIVPGGESILVTAAIIGRAVWGETGAA